MLDLFHNTAFTLCLGLLCGELHGWYCRGAHERELRRREIERANAKIAKEQT